MFYTQRRAKLDVPGVEWCHGTEIGVAESHDEGLTWTYRGTLALKAPDAEYSFWAPDVIRDDAGRYHFFVSYVPGAASTHRGWGGQRHILHAPLLAGHWLGRGRRSRRRQPHLRIGPLRVSQWLSARNTGGLSVQRWFDGLLQCAGTAGRRWTRYCTQDHVRRGSIGHRCAHRGGTCCTKSVASVRAGWNCVAAQVGTLDRHRAFAVRHHPHHMEQCYGLPLRRRRDGLGTVHNAL